MPDLFVPPTTPDKPSTPPPSEPKTADAPKPHIDKEILKTKLQKTFMHPFSSFHELPDGVRFASQGDSETILLFLRMHFITNVPWIFSVIILALFPLLVNQLLLLTSGSPIVIPANLGLVLLLFFYLGLFAYALVSFMTWFYNITIVTDERIIDIDFSDIVYHDVAQTKLSLVEDVNYTQTGFIRSFFNFGDVFAQTAGGKENIEALAVPKPIESVQIIADRIGEGDKSG